MSLRWNWRASLSCRIFENSFQLESRPSLRLGGPDDDDANNNGNEEYDDDDDDDDDDSKKSVPALSFVVADVVARLLQH